MVAIWTQNGLWGLERCLPKGFGSLPSTFVNNFFDQSNPSMRKVDKQKEKKEKREKNDVHSGH